MTPTPIRYAIPCAVLSILLSACGGGDSSSGGSAAAGSATAVTTAPTATDSRFHRFGERLSLSAASFAAPATGGTVAITVNRLDGTGGSVSIAFATADASASAGTDYTATSGRVSWNAGDAAPKTFSVPVAVNHEATAKSFSVVLSNPSGASVGAVSSATVTIAAGTTPSAGSSSGGSTSGSTTSGATTSGSTTSSGTTSSSSGSSGSTGASGTTFWVYHAGVFAWPGDYSFEAVPNYTDTSGVPLDGAYDIKVSVTGAWGGFQPYATNWDFDTSPYNYLTFALKPTVANMQAQLYFMQVGDVPVGNTVDVFKYGPAPVAGQWNVYKIPLSAIGVAGIHIYKFAIQDQTGMSTDVFYLDDVGFTQ